MNYDRRYFLLHGWARYLARSDEHKREQDRIMRFRVQDGIGGGDGRFGILVSDDMWSLQYQRLAFRYARARRAIGLDIVKEYRFVDNGPLTIEIFPGCPIPGWETDSEEIRAEKARNIFQDRHRLLAQRAKRLLRERGIDIQAEMDRRDQEENYREAWG